MALGVALRILRYGLNFPLWVDEAALAGNLIDRGYSELLTPLEFYQVAPPLFLWVELASVRALGFSEASLRLFPLTCGVGSMLLLRPVAARLFGGVPMLLAVGCLAVAPHPIRHAAEVKPYASDLLVTLILLALVGDWWRDRSRSRGLWWMAAISPVAIGLSHPAVFVAVGIGLVACITASRSASRRVRLGGLAALLSPIASFLALFLVVTGAQCSGGSLRGMRNYWADSFPPLDGVFSLLRWLVLTHSGQMFAYPEGGRRGESAATTILCLVAIVALWRRRDRSLLSCLLAPFALTLAAATLRRYPYGGEARIAQHLAPLICLLFGLGAATALRSLPRRVGRAWVLTATLVGLASLGLLAAARDVAKPYQGEYELRAREFARWFWDVKGQGAELGCARADFGLLEPRRVHFAASLHLCNREICRPRRPGNGPRLQDVTRDHPLRIAVFDETPLTNPAFLALRDSIVASLPARSVVRYTVRTKKSGLSPQVVTLFEFAPPDGSAIPIASRVTEWPPAANALEDRPTRLRR